MNTAKTLQLLDVQSNNISPATNIESIYYEVMDGGVIYRNSLYRHFPIYVNYNNNIDEAYKVKKSDNSSDSKEIIALTPNNEEDLSNIINASTSTFRLTAGQNKNDILLSSIQQTHLKNTRYYKLDVTTYNFSDIMSLYAPKLWVSNKFNSIDNSINNIKYDSSIITLYGVGTNSAFIRTTSDVGNLEKDASGNILNGMRINDLLDKILFKKQYPYIYDASIYMDKVETNGNVNINLSALGQFGSERHDTEIYDYKNATAQYNIFKNTGKIKIVYQQDANSIVNDINSALNINILDENNNIENENIEKNISLDDCYSVYENKIITISDGIPDKTPLAENYNHNDWKTFENTIISLIKDTFNDYISETYFNSINWKSDVISKMYKGNYLQNNKEKQDLIDPEHPYEKTEFRKMLDHIFGEEIFRNSYFKIIKNLISINSGPIAYDSNSAEYKTNYGTPIEDILEEFLPNVYCNYQLPYNDYYHSYETINLEPDDHEGYKIKTTPGYIPLFHKFNLYMPIVINNKIYYVTGIKEQYIEHIQNTAQDTIIYIPKTIDNSDIENNINLPELYAISQGGIFMPANNWVISSINDEITVANIFNLNIIGNNGEIDTEKADYKELLKIMNIFSIYVINAQSSYDNNIIGSIRTIKIKIHTTIGIIKSENIIKI